MRREMTRCGSRYTVPRRESPHQDRFPRERPPGGAQSEEIRTGRYAQPGIIPPVPGNRTISRRKLSVEQFPDETAGRVAPDSVSGVDGVLMGGPLWQPGGGKVGGALKFDGVNDSVLTDFVLDPADGPFSVLAWIKGGAPGEVIVSQDGSVGGAGWLLAAPSTGRLMTDLKAPGPGGRSLSAAMVITDDDWHEVDDG